MKQLLKELEEERKKIWTVNKPEDVDLMRIRLGTRDQNFSICTYAIGETNGVVDFLYCIRITAQQESVDVKTLVAVTCNLLSLEVDRYRVSYNMLNAAKLVEKTVDVLKKKVKTNKEFIEVVEALMFYLGKLNYWLDLEMPWNELSIEYEKIKTNCK
jgi:hypothetical protein